MLISGTVILYNPNEAEVIENIQSYISYLDRLLVFANSNCSQKFIERVKGVSTKIIFITNEQNEGIAKPLNKALTLVGEKYNWLLTMDQDSNFEANQAAEYFARFNKLINNSSDIAIVCPNHTVSREQAIVKNSYAEVISAITSGSIVNMKICKQLNGYDEKLFIDDVDIEYCYRCILAGYKIIEFSDVFLNHQLGTKKRAGYFALFKTSDRSIHSPFRVYFMVRNFLYVSSKYKKLLPDEIKKRRKGLLVILKNNLFFSGRFVQVFVAAIKGYLHFKMDKFSS